MKSENEIQDAIRNAIEIAQNIGRLEAQNGTYELNTIYKAQLEKELNKEWIKINNLIEDLHQKLETA